MWFRDMLSVVLITSERTDFQKWSDEGMPEVRFRMLLVCTL